MPMIVDPDAPLVEPPVVVVSPDGWLSAAVDGTWAGVTLAVDYTVGAPLAGAANVRKVRIMRTDPAATAAVPVRSADSAWAIGGRGTAYDHEAPLGVAVIYTATPTFEDGTTGASSSLAVTVAAPVKGLQDVWIKSLDEPGVSARVTVTSWPDLTWGARIEQSAVEGSAFPVTSQDVYGAAGSDMTVDAEGSQIEILERLLTTPGVRLIQTRPDYHRVDQYVLFSDVKQGMYSTPDQARSYTMGITQVGRPDTAGQPLRVPGWSWDALAAQFATWDAVEASYSSWASLSVDGAL